MLTHHIVYEAMSGKSTINTFENVCAMLYKSKHKTFSHIVDHRTGMSMSLTCTFLPFRTRRDEFNSKASLTTLINYYTSTG